MEAIIEHGNTQTVGIKTAIGHDVKGPTVKWLDLTDGETNEDMLSTIGLFLQESIASFNIKPHNLD